MNSSRFENLKLLWKVTFNVVLKVLQNSQENTCPRPSLEILLKGDFFNADAFLWISEIFKNTFFYRTTPVVAPLVEMLRLHDV